MRTLLFDMGNVLVHFSHERMCRQMGELCGRSGSDIRELLIDSGLQWDFERGRLSEDEFHRAFTDVVGQTIDADQLRLAGCDIFQLNTSIVPVLDALKRCGYRLVLLSNTSVSHFEFIREQYDVLDRFDDFVVSYRVGAIKPDAAIFEAALKTADCAPEECFYTDDIIRYVEQARQFGIDAEQFTETPVLVEHLRSRGIPLEISH